VDCWINSTQVAPHHHRPAAIAAAIAAIASITTPVIATLHRDRRSAAEKAHGGDDSKRDEGLSTHGGFSLFTRCNTDEILGWIAQKKSPANLGRWDARGHGWSGVGNVAERGSRPGSSAHLFRSAIDRRLLASVIGGGHSASI
jgi:hypothetical protein